MSGALSTAKPACSTLRLCSVPTWPMSCNTSRPMRRLSRICAVVLMSARARSTCASLTLARLTPPTPSAAFSLLAIQRAAALVAPFSDKANTDAPRAVGVKNASAWMDTNKSACTRRALRTRSCSGTKKSASRVSMARMPGTLFRRSRNLMATCSTTSFSRRPVGPTAPGSSPPWPGSMATITRRLMLRCSSAGRVVGGGAGVLRAGCGAPGAGMAGGLAGCTSPGGSAEPGVGCGLSDGLVGGLMGGMRPINSPKASCTLRAATSAAVSRARISASSGSGASVG